MRPALLTEPSRVSMSRAVLFAWTSALLDLLVRTVTLVLVVVASVAAAVAVAVVAVVASVAAAVVVASVAGAAARVATTRPRAASLNSRAPR
jgi:hypothetical protein